MEIRKDYTQFYPSLLFLCTPDTFEKSPYPRLCKSAIFFSLPSSFKSDTHALVHQAAVVPGVFVSSLFWFFYLRGGLKNFANTLWHRDPTWLLGLVVSPTKTSNIKSRAKSKASFLFTHHLPNTHRVEHKVN